MGAGRGAIQACSKRECWAWEGGKTDTWGGNGEQDKSEGTRERRKGETHASGGTCGCGKGGRDCVTHGTCGHGRGAGRERGRLRTQEGGWTGKGQRRLPVREGQVKGLGWLGTIWVPTRAQAGKGQARLAKGVLVHTPKKEKPQDLHGPPS
jgi:hypothetical protein